MVSAKGLAELVIEVLRKSREWMTTSELAEEIAKTNPQFVSEKKSRSQNPKIISGDLSVVNQIKAEIGASKARFQKSYPEIEINDDGTVRKWRSLGLEPSTDVTKSSADHDVKSNEFKFSEFDLYTPLKLAIRDKLKVVCHRVDEKRTERKRISNEWLHPDLVGIQDHFHFESEDPNLKAACLTVNPNRASMWAFEVKKEITTGNIREFYAQAVMNSSWANYGYLVCTNSVIDDRVLEEVRGLAQRFGIGLIRFSPKHDLDTVGLQIIVPAIKREEIDTYIVHRLADNTDFKLFLKAVAVWAQSSEFTGVLDW